MMTSCCMLILTSTTQDCYLNTSDCLKESLFLCHGLIMQCQIMTSSCCMHVLTTQDCYLNTSDCLKESLFLCHGLIVQCQIMTSCCMHVLTAQDCYLNTSDCLRDAHTIVFCFTRLGLIMQWQIKRFLGILYRINWYWSTPSLHETMMIVTVTSYYSVRCYGNYLGNWVWVWVVTVTTYFLQCTIIYVN